MNESQMVKIALLASGTGSNAAKIIQHFSNHSIIKVDCLLTNRKDAGVNQVASTNKLDGFYFSDLEFKQGNAPLKLLKRRKIDWLILAGFLKKIPKQIIAAYEKKIINIHPSLLPKYGGKGMYGNRVHQAAIDAGDKLSGISIHFVNQHFDQGEIIFQKSCEIKAEDTAESLAKRVQKLEHQYFPKVVENTILKSIDKKEVI